MIDKQPPASREQALRILIRELVAEHGEDSSINPRTAWHDLIMQLRRILIIDDPAPPPPADVAPPAAGAMEGTIVGRDWTDWKLVMQYAGEARSKGRTAHADHLNEIALRLRDAAPSPSADVAERLAKLERLTRLLTGRTKGCLCDECLDEELATAERNTLASAPRAGATSVTQAVREYFNTNNPDREAAPRLAEALRDLVDEVDRHEKHYEEFPGEHPCEWSWAFLEDARKALATQPRGRRAE